MTAAVVEEKAKTKTKGIVIVHDSQAMREQARTAYLNFRRSWVGFANSVAEVKRSDAWRDLDYQSFKEFCLKEFSDIDYNSILKLVAIVEDNWIAAFDAKTKVDPTAYIPSYEACYMITAASNKIPKAAVPKLRKEVLDGKLNSRTVREKLKELGGIKTRDEVADVEIDEIVKDEAPVEIAEESTDFDRLASKLIDRAEFIAEHLDSLCAITENTALTEKLAVTLQTMIAPLDKFLDHVDTLGETE